MKKILISLLLVSLYYTGLSAKYLEDDNVPLIYRIGHISYPKANPSFNGSLGEGFHRVVVIHYGTYKSSMVTYYDRYNKKYVQANVFDNYLNRPLGNGEYYTMLQVFQMDKDAIFTVKIKGTYSKKIYSFFPRYGFFPSY